MTYALPVKVDSAGNVTTYPNATFTNAKDDGFCSGGSCGTTNLNTSFRAYRTYGNNYSAPYIHTNNDDTAQQAYYYNYTTGTPPASCASNNKYTKVQVATNSAEAQNFANWYSYYRKRMLMAKSATGAAFVNLDDKYRIGYTVLSETGVPTNGNTFLPISKFNPTQKKSWFDNLYTAGCPSGTCSTPTRGALTKAGRYYAGQFVSGSVPDPIQYSCQQNFTVLVTDGYWNTGDETSCSSSSKYGACRMTGNNSVGDQDGGNGIARPYLDGIGVSNSLADIAYYYWATDLRPNSGDMGGTTDEGTNIDVSIDNVTPAGTDTATWQHMNTFTVGLGVPGVLNYADNYLQGGSSDYNAILQGHEELAGPARRATTIPRAFPRASTTSGMPPSTVAANTSASRRPPR